MYLYIGFFNNLLYFNYSMLILSFVGKMILIAMDLVLQKNAVIYRILVLLEGKTLKMDLYGIDF